MTRQDIGDYLGLTVETVSRALAKLKKEGLISIPSPHIFKMEDLDGVTDLGEVE
jgi:DNA-binding transcriptional regulator LsrR (DeoR family)